MKVFFELPEGQACEDLDIGDLTPSKAYSSQVVDYAPLLQILNDAGNCITIRYPGYRCAHLGLGKLQWQEAKQEEE